VRMRRKTGVCNLVCGKSSDERRMKIGGRAIVFPSQPLCVRAVEKVSTHPVPNVTYFVFSFVFSFVFARFPVLFNCLYNFLSSFFPFPKSLLYSNLYQLCGIRAAPDCVLLCVIFKLAF
jgi:hypothetical protein